VEHWLTRSRRYDTAFPSDFERFSLRKESMPKMARPLVGAAAASQRARK